MNTTVKGKEVLLKRPPMALFSMFDDLSRFTQNVPEKPDVQISSTKDSVQITFKGIHLGVVVESREPFSRVVLKDDGQSFVPFRLTFIMNPIGLDQTLFHIELEAELNFMMKMMIGSKLQETVDSITDQIENAINNGQMPDFSQFTGGAGMPNFS